MAEPPPRGSTPLLFLALWLTTTYPAWRRPRLVTAWPEGEADNHVWMWVQALRSGGAYANWPEGTGLPLIDPIHLPIVALGLLADPAVAWNVTWLADVALALLGGFAFGREATGREAGGQVGMAMLGGSAVLHGVGVFGVTEAWPIGWLALFAAAAWRTAATGSAAATAAAAGCLAAWGACGAYAWVFGALAVPFLVAAAPGPHRRRVGLAVAVGALATVPQVVAFLDARELFAHRLAADATPMAWDPGWRAAPQGGADLVNVVVGERTTVDSGRSVYLGLGLWLAIAGAIEARRDASARRLLAGAAVLVVLGLGTWLRVAGVRAVPLPGALLAMLPLLSGLHHTYRALLPATVLLIPLAAGWAARRPQAIWGPALAVLVAGDALLGAGNPWPRPQYDPRPPPALAALPGDGPVVLLPFDNGRSQFGRGTPRLYDRWGPWLDRPLTENYEGPDALLRSNRLVAAADALCFVAPEIPPSWRPDAAFADPVAVARPEVRDGAVAQLRRRGAEWVVLRTDVCLLADEAAALLTGALGPADAEGRGVRAWKVAD